MFTYPAPESNDPPPLILTLTLDAPAFAFFTALRKKYFPPERNYIDAHLTLFHHLTGDRVSIMQTIRAAALQQPVVTLQVTDIVSIGNGVAYRIDNPELQSLHHHLQQHWNDMLTAQDRQRLRPHITVQNKVPAPVAKNLLYELKATFSPFTFYGTGLSVWEYLGGPWKLVETFDFNKA